MCGSAVCAVFKSVCAYLKIYVVKSALCVAEILLLLKVCAFESLGYGSQVTRVGKNNNPNGGWEAEWKYNP